MYKVKMSFPWDGDDTIYSWMLFISMLIQSSPKLLGDVSIIWSFDSLKLVWIKSTLFPPQNPESHLSNDGSLLNISFGTVAGASGTSPISDCRDCKCLSTSSAVMCPSENALFLFAAACAFAAFFVVCFFLFGGLIPLPCDAFIESAFRLCKYILNLRSHSLQVKVNGFYSLFRIFGAHIIFRWFGVVAFWRWILWFLIL